MKLFHLRWLAPLLVAVFVSGPAFATAGLPMGAAARPASAPAPTAPQGLTPAAAAGLAGLAGLSLGGLGMTSAAPTATQSYAEREQQAPELQNFKGGVGVYIGGSALVIVLLVILILVLL